MTTDPHIAMRTIRLIFAESQYNYSTNINGTRKEIVDYFRGAPLNVGGSDERETIRSPIAIEFIGQGITVVL